MNKWDGTAKTKRRDLASAEGKKFKNAMVGGATPAKGEYFRPFQSDDQSSGTRKEDIRAKTKRRDQWRALTPLSRLCDFFRRTGRQR